jgi:hypothetical protein
MLPRSFEEMNACQHTVLFFIKSKAYIAVSFSR